MKFVTHRLYRNGQVGRQVSSQPLWLLGRVQRGPMVLVQLAFRAILSSGLALCLLLQNFIKLMPALIGH